MKLPKDKALHLAFGAAAAVAAVGIVLLARHVNLPVAMLVTAALLGAAYEYQQKLRGEGASSAEDAAYTAAGGAVATALASLAGLV